VLARHIGLRTNVPRRYESLRYAQTGTFAARKYLWVGGPGGAGPERGARGRFLVTPTLAIAESFDISWFFNLGIGRGDVLRAAPPPPCSIAFVCEF